MKGVIISAGYGSRFFPVTKSVPKELLPLWTRPIIDFTVDELVRAGVDEILLVSSRRKTSLENYFDRDVELEWFYQKNEGKLQLLKSASAKIFYVRQKYMKGVGDALLTVEPFVGSEPFVVAYPDDVFVDGGEAVKKMIEVQEKTGADVVLAVVERKREELSRYGVVDVDYDESEVGVFRVRKVVEKPEIDKAPSNFAVVGRYVFSPNLIGLLREDYKNHREGEFYHIGAINRLAGMGKVVAVEVSGDVVLDTGEPETYLLSQVDYALRTRGERFYHRLKEVLKRYEGN